MKAKEQGIDRRSVLKAGLIAAVAVAARPLSRRAHAQVRAAAIVAAPVETVPSSPDDPTWFRVTPTPVALEPQDLVVPKLVESGAKQIDVRALFDAERLAFLVEWRDAHSDADMGTVMQYRDGVAIQFPADPSAGTTSVMMGQRNRGVTIYHWKSDWQFGLDRDVDEAYPNMYNDIYLFSGKGPGEMAEASDYLTRGDKAYLTAAAAGNALADPLAQQALGPVQKMRATGFGTLEPDEAQDGAGFGVWKDGVWRIVLSFPRRQPGFTFMEDGLIPVAFAVWDGSRNERNGQKAYSQWKDMRLALPLEPPGTVTPPPITRDEGGSILPPVIGGVAGAIAAAIAALIGLRMRRPREGERRQ